MTRNNQYSSLQLGDWVKGKVVGSGSFGNVNLAMSRATGALFVVKTAQYGAGFQSLENEADILENMNSPYIVQYIGREFFDKTNSDHRELNIFLEYLAGGSLSDVAEKFGGCLEEQVIRLYTREILLGLQYLHKKGIVHCDLKCKNVLLDSSGNIKLADFGCAKRIGDRKTNKNLMQSWQSICGTPLWMAPEVLRNEGISFASDIWSLGCTVIEMATGRPPWGGQVSNSIAAVLRIASGNELPQFPTGFSKEGLDFLAKCLERNPKRRWSTEKLLSHPFVLGNSAKNSRKEDSSSPASILDVRMYGGGYESEGTESPNVGENLDRILFSSRCCSNRHRLAQKRQRESDSASTENWITVRSCKGNCV